MQTSPLLSPPDSHFPNDSGFPPEEPVYCSSCTEKDKQLENVRKELVKVLLESKQTNEKITTDLEKTNFSLLQCNKNLKNLEVEGERLKKEIKN